MAAAGSGAGKASRTVEPQRFQPAEQGAPVYGEGYLPLPGECSGPPGPTDGGVGQSSLPGHQDPNSSLWDSARASSSEVTHPGGPETAKAGFRAMVRRIYQTDRDTGWTKGRFRLEQGHVWLSSRCGVRGFALRRPADSVSAAVTPGLGAALPGPGLILLGYHQGGPGQSGHKAVSFAQPAESLAAKSPQAQAAAASRAAPGLPSAQSMATDSPSSTAIPFS